MERAINETERRRAKQLAFNEANGIVPRGVQKPISDILEARSGKAARGKGPNRKVAESGSPAYGTLDPEQIQSEIRRLEKEMFSRARELEFELAAQLRDQVQHLKEQLLCT